MTTARYIVSNVNATNGSFLDLGIQGRGLTDTGAARDITYVDSEATTPAAIQRVYYRAGMSLNMAASTVTGRSYEVYLDGASTDYTINAGTGTITLTSDTTQVLTVRAEATTTVVFSNGQLAGNALTAAVSGTGSLSYSGTAGAAQNLRILTGDSAGEAFAIARSGTTVTASGHRGVDALYVEAGGAADATRLGGGKDVVYLTSNFADYTLSVRGLTLVLQHSTRSAETVYVSMGVAGAATNDRVVFANGAVDTSEIREAYINNAGGANSFTGITTLAHISTQAGRAVTSVDAAVTTGLYTPATPAAPTLTTDTAAGVAVNTDGITRNGAISAGARGANADVTDVLQFSTNGGTTFQNVPGGGLTLAGQVSGATGVTYAAGDVQLRSVSASGVVSAVSSSASAIVVDNAAAAVATGAASTTLTGMQVSTTAGSSSTGNKPLASVALSNTTGMTLSAWVYVTQVNASEQMLFMGGTNNAIHIAIHTQNWKSITAAGDWMDTGVTATVGWHYVAYTHSGSAGIQELYLDGTRITAANAAAPTNLAANTNIVIGTHRLDANTNSSAIFREVEIWNRVLTAAEIATTATDSPNLADADLLSYYPLNNGSAANLRTGGGALTLSGTANANATAPDLTNYTGSDEMLVSATANITGTGAEPNATVTVTLTSAGNPTITGTATALTDGTWTAPVTSLVDRATYVVTATQTDVAGNTSAVATAARDLVVNAAMPTPPVLAVASDSGSTGDLVTNDTTPTLTGTLLAGTAAGTAVAIWVNGAQVTSVTATTTSGDFQVDYTAGTWTYTPSVALTGSFATFQIRVGAEQSNVLNVTFDTVATAPTITSVVPAMVTTASGNLVITGTAEASSSAVSVTLTDGAGSPVTDTNAATLVVGADGSVTWSVTFTQAEIAALGDGTVTVSVAATDRAGNIGNLAANPTFTLELVNSAPVANSGMTDASLARVISTTATGTILNLLDTDANVATTGTVDDAFTDADAVGSANGTLTYSGQLITGLGVDAAVGGGDDVYGALPGWLEVTAAGVVQVVAAQVPLAGVYNLHLTATDGAATPLSATRDVQLTVSAGVALNTALGINQATVATVSDFDLRSDIVFTATGNLTAVTGNSITLHNQADGAVTTGDIVIDAAAAGVVLAYNAGTDTTSIRINPGFDLDVNATYTLSVAAGAFTNASSETSLAFSTVFASVDPNGADNIAQQFAAGASVLSDGATWVDITADGNGTGQTVGAARDVSTAATVLYAGAATVNGANSFDVNDNYYASVTGFGADDVLYFDDQANGANYGLVTNFDTALTFLQSDSTGSTIAAAPDRNSLSMSGVDGLNQAPTLLVQLAGATTMATSVHGVGAGTMETLLGVTPAAVMVA